jgi:hypothetical protein
MLQDNLKIAGEIKITFCDISSQEALALQDKISKASGAEYRTLVDELHRRFGKRSITMKNLCPIAGRRVLARILSGEFTYTGKINYCVLGTYSTPSTNDDTQLGTEVFRKLVSSLTYSTTSTPIAYLSTFFTATETTGTYQEIGHVIDGTASANTGQLFSRISTPESGDLPKVKAATESMTVDYKVTIN